MASVIAVLGPKSRPELDPIAAKTAPLTSVSTRKRSGVSDQPALRIARSRLGGTGHRQATLIRPRAATMTADPHKIPATTAEGVTYASCIDEPHALEPVEPEQAPHP